MEAIRGLLVAYKVFGVLDGEGASGWRNWIYVEVIFIIIKFVSGRECSLFYVLFLIDIIAAFHLNNGNLFLFFVF